MFKILLERIKEIKARDIAEGLKELFDYKNRTIEISETDIIDALDVVLDSLAVDVSREMSEEEKDQFLKEYIEDEEVQEAFSKKRKEITKLL